ncbi:hypothetical protein GQ44DRAFT_722049 [Phaeosphaeriaceae sp. PMI808]|nr:hypothetical protein GQ44DRAFT_722049 [Phaeosphaeriaceae sp. PMI808]
MHSYLLYPFLYLTFASTFGAATGVVEVDLVFPRNETYAPTDVFPVVLAFQNAHLAPYLAPALTAKISKADNSSDYIRLRSYDLRLAAFTTHEPYYEVRYTPFQQEGQYMLTWEFGWASCTNLTLGYTEGKYYGPPYIYNWTSRWVYFTIQNSGRPVDLVAATSDDTCSEISAVAIDIATTLPNRVATRPDYATGSECASTAFTTPTPTPCKAKIGSAAASSISSSVSHDRCIQTGSPQDSCSKSTASQLAGGIMACIAIVLVVSL